MFKLLNRFLAPTLVLKWNNYPHKEKFIDFKEEGYCDICEGTGAIDSKGTECYLCSGKGNLILAAQYRQRILHAISSE